MATTVQVPDEFLPVFERAEELVGSYFRCKKEQPEHGHIDIEGERYILVRAASMSVEFYDLMTALYQGREHEAFQVARNLLFNVAHFIGRADARRFHSRLGLEDAVERLSAGPVHFAHSGWAFVNIHPESHLSRDDSCLLVYDHPYSFESDSWLKAARRAPFPVCFMNAGYSSGWCEESFGVPLVATEILCTAQGSDHCRFIMAHPSRIQDRVAEYLESRPEVARQVTSFEVPGEFARKELEDRLRISEDRYRLLFEHALDAILILEHGQIAQVNQRATEMLGRARSQLHGRSCAQLAPPVQPTGQDSECYFDAHLERALDGSVEVFDLQCTGAGGQLIDTVVSLHRVEGIPGSVLALLRDVTEERRARAERERLEDEVRQLQKMEALGTLAGGVAHDFNNILTGILGAVEVLRGELAEDSPCHAVAADARAAIGRASGLVRQLLTFASSRQHLTQTVDLGSLVEEGVRLLRETMDPRIDLRTQVTGKTGLVDGDPNQLTQVLVNLALNSRDAILQSGAGGGESRVGSDPWIQILVRPAGTMQPPGNSGAPAREYVLLQVVDSGAGMPGHVRDRACEPFFTTKPVGQGTGLGLTMVYGIVQRHGGWLEIDSEPGRGATVSIYLPVVTTAPPRPHPSRVTPTVADRTGTILFVDDEVLLRELAHRHLEPIGHRVISAGSGNEALEILQQEDAEDLVVVLDLLMPGLSGLETLRRMLKLRPRLRVLVASGFSTEAGAPELLAEGAASFLPKPYSFSELADQVQVLLCGVME